MIQIIKRLPEVLSRSFGTKFFFISLSLAIGSGCNEASVVGLDVQPASDLLNVGWQDTTTIISSTVKEDSLRTDGALLISGDAMIGTYYDPVFGKTQSSLYTQLRLPGNNPTFGTNPVCDSVVLSLTYSTNSYGKKDRKLQRISVYQLNESMNILTNYYSNNSLSYSSNDLADAFLFTPRPNSNVVVFGDTVKPHLRVPLEQSFGQVILNNQGAAGNLASNSTFQEFIKGLYITSEVTTSNPGDGNILHFKMGDALSKLTIYYHNSNATNNDSLRYDISLSSVARFSAFSHDYTTAYPYLQSQLTSNAVDTALFIQALAGSKVKIELPHLMHWNDSGKVAINRAELVIKVDQTNSLYQLDTFAAPTKLVLFGISENNANYVIPDAFDPNVSYGGIYDATNKEYRFIIDRYIQQVLNGSRANTGFYLVATAGAVNGNRVVIGSGNSKGSQKMKLNITYTKLH